MPSAATGAVDPRAADGARDERREEWEDVCSWTMEGRRLDVLLAACTSRSQSEDRDRWFV